MTGKKDFQTRLFVMWCPNQVILTLEAICGPKIGRGVGGHQRLGLLDFFLLAVDFWLVFCTLL